MRFSPEKQIPPHPDILPSSFEKIKYIPQPSTHRGGKHPRETPPHVRGKPPERPASRSGQETPPHVRGKRGGDLGRNAGSRNTPTCAGKTLGELQLYQQYFNSAEFHSRPASGIPFFLYSDFSHAGSGYLYAQLRWAAFRCLLFQFSKSVRSVHRVRLPRRR